MGGIFRDVAQLRCYSPLDGLHVFETEAHNDPLEVGKNKKSQSKIRGIKKLFQYRDVFSQPGTAGRLGRCEQMQGRREAATICLVKTLVSSHALSKRSPC